MAESHILNSLSCHGWGGGLHGNLTRKLKALIVVVLSSSPMQCAIFWKQTGSVHCKHAMIRALIRTRRLERSPDYGIFASAGASWPKVTFDQHGSEIYKSMRTFY